MLIGGDGDRLFWDLETISNRRFTADPMEAIRHHAALHDLASVLVDTPPSGEVVLTDLGPPVPRPEKVFAIGLNYRAHIEETGSTESETPVIFTKYPSCLVGPAADLELVGDRCDHEVEVVAVIGRRCRSVDAAEAWGVIAGLMVGNDVSDRVLQRASTPPHFNLGKSRDTFGPTGPYVVSTDLLADPNALDIACFVNDERRQHSRTDLMITPIAELVSYLSSVCTLEPGDLVFTGTPDGVGAATGNFLQPGDTVRSVVESLGEMRNPCRSSPWAPT